MAVKYDPAEWWDGHAQKYWESGDRRTRAHHWKKLTSRISGTCLEVGCAFGHFSRYLRADVGYLGIDISSKFCEYAARENPGRLFLQADLLKLDSWWVDRFEWACCFQTLEHFSELAKPMRTLLRIAPNVAFSVPVEDPKAEKRMCGHRLAWGTREELALALNRAVPGIQVEWLSGGAAHHLVIVHRPYDPTRGETPESTSFLYCTNRDY